MMKIGVPAAEIQTLLNELDLEIDEEFNARQAFATAQLAHNSRAYGLSLGDCVCLTMARLRDQAGLRQTGGGLRSPTST